MGGLVRNVSIFENSQFNNNSILNQFNGSQFDQIQMFNNKSHNFRDEGPILLIKNPSSKKKIVKKSRKELKKTGIREVRKKEHGGGGGEGHGHGGGHGGGHEEHGHGHEGHGHGHGGGHEHGHGGKGCVVKYIKGGGKHEEEDDKKKYMVPMMIGFMSAKAILLPVVLKALAILAGKGLMLGLIATVMASILSLKKMMEPSVKIEGKKDDVTKIEVVPLPIKERVHHHHPKHYVDITEESWDQGSYQ